MNVVWSAPHRGNCYSAPAAQGTPRLRALIGLTAQRLTRAARAHVPKPTRRTACTHVSRAMQAARRRSVF